jgi:hypothetical protein
VGLALASPASAVTNAAWLSCTAEREFQHGVTASEADGKEQIQPVHCEFFAVLVSLPWTGNQRRTIALECVSPLTAAVGCVWPWQRYKIDVESGLSYGRCVKKWDEFEALYDALEMRCFTERTLTTDFLSCMHGRMQLVPSEAPWPDPGSLQPTVPSAFTCVANPRRHGEKVQELAPFPKYATRCCAPTPPGVPAGQTAGGRQRARGAARSARGLYAPAGGTTPRRRRWSRTVRGSRAS